MAGFRIEFQKDSAHLPELGLWLDSNEPQTGPEKVFISHAHSDHVAPHREVILTAPTATLMRARVAGAGIEHVLDFDEPARFESERGFRITLLPAGHIFGSAMSLIEEEGGTLLYTGDFKLRRGLSAEPCEPRRADILIMETTYGRPQYVFPPAEDVLKGVVRFCREALDNEETPVLLGYSLGKSQELLCGLADAALPLMLHGAVFKLTQLYEQFGRCFPKYERYESGSARGKVLLCPPSVVNSAMLRNLGRTRTAILTGWAVDANARYRYQCDAAFALSDHADFPDLIEMVKRVQPRKVYTLHGFAADFAGTLRELGFDAQALSENEQFTLALGVGQTSPRPGSGKFSRGQGSPGRESPADQQARIPGQHPFVQFATTCARIAGTASKLEKIRVLSDYLRGLKADAAAMAATWFSGRPFAGSQNKVLQLGWAVLRDALCAAAGTEERALRQAYLKHSDLGESAFEILQHREIDPSLGLEQVDELFHRLHSARGPLAKRPLLAAALSRCSALEAKFLVKIITGDLRIGLKEGLVEEAIAAAFSKSPDEVRQAHLLVGDIGETARLAATDKLSEAVVVPFRPIRFMLASPEETAVDVMERTRSAVADRDDPNALNDADATVIWLEDKYDGVRCQLHKVGERVALYSRDLKEISHTFIELADAARRMPMDIVLDGEIVAMRGDEVLPFADLQKRLGRREADLFLCNEAPVEFVAFDVLWRNGESALHLPLKQRRETLESLGPWPKGIRLARITPARSVEEIERAFDAARSRGNEGLMIKNPASTYSPGRRGLAWLKLKKALATLDCVVIGAEYGHGKRNKVLSDYTFAVRDEQTGELKTIGKAYSGLTDAEIASLTTHFLKSAIRQHGRYFEVPPEIVLEIAFDRIQKSQRHDSGLAMRFPRIARIRTDKSVAEIDTLATARKLVK